MTIYVHKHGFEAGVSSHDALVALAQFQVLVALDSVTNVTNSVGGSPSGTYAVVAVPADCVNAAASGTDLADKATTESALGTVRDAIKEVYAKYNTAAAKVGLPSLTDNLGGTAADGTAGAITVSVTGAATGVQAAALNTTLGSLNEAMYVAAAAVAKLAHTSGTAKPVIATGAIGTWVTTVPALTISGGTAADPGVKKSVVDAKLALYRTNLNTIITALNGAFAGPTAAPVVVVA